jgi:hypothetical protein
MNKEITITLDNLDQYPIVSTYVIEVLDQLELDYDYDEISNDGLTYKVVGVRNEDHRHAQSKQ